jgi:hypothetical protein
MCVVWVWEVVDVELKTEISSRVLSVGPDKTPSGSRRPVPGGRDRLGVPQIKQQLTRPVLHS